MLYSYNPLLASNETKKIYKNYLQRENLWMQRIYNNTQPKLIFSIDFLNHIFFTIQQKKKNFCN